MFLVLLALLVAGNSIEALLGRPRWSAARRYALLLLACSAASFVNPYGSQLHVHIIEYLRADWIRNLVQEFQAPTFRSEGQFQYEVLLIAGLLVSGALLQKEMRQRGAMGVVPGPLFAGERPARPAVCHSGRAADRL